MVLMAGSSDALFLDTNILVYANVVRAPLHAEALDAIQSRESAGLELWISRQVIREYLATLTHPQSFTQPISAKTLVTQVRSFERRFRVADDTSRVTDHLLTLMQGITIGGAQMHDANIIATMQAYGVQNLLTHNSADFARFAHLVVVLPLVGP